MSEVRANTISAANGTDPVTLTKQSAAKAWVAYDQGVNAIKSSFGISSQVDDATGRTTSNFTSSFSSVDNYCVVGSIFDGSGANDTRIFNHDVNNDTYTASAVKYYCWDGSGLNDAHRFFVSFHGDLA